LRASRRSDIEPPYRSGIEARVHFYLLAGLTVDSEIDLPGAIVAPRPACGADVTIRRGAAPFCVESASTRGPNWAIDGDRFLLRIPDVARLLVTGGRSIEVELEGAGTIADAAPFVAGSAFGILLHQRGHVLLHASAVSVDGGAVLFCGPSGAGKSTLAAALDRRGHALVTDDICAIGFDAGGKPFAHPDGRSLKLWAQAIERLDLGESRGAAVRDRLQKFYVEPSRAPGAALPLRAVYALREDRLGRRIEIERLNVVDAAAMLRNNAYHPQIIRRMGREAPYFRAVAAILSAASVFTLARPLEFSRLLETVEALEAHWREHETSGPEPRA
jgi:hypothetical protein